MSYVPETYRSANASSSAVGYAAFAVTLWMFSMINAGWFDASQQMLTIMLAVTLGTAMALAGLLAWFRGRSHDMCLLLAFAAFWWSWALAAHVVDNGAIAPGHGYLGWYYMVWAVVAFFLWIAAFRAGTGRVLFDLVLWLSLLWLAIGAWSDVNGVTILGGYLGLITALLGFYLAAAEVVNSTFARAILPTGEQPYAADPAAAAEFELRRGPMP